MGFDPGSFTNRDGTKVHWELKDGPRIVLWDAIELKKFLDLDLDNAIEAAKLLDLLITMAGGER